MILTEKMFGQGQEDDASLMAWRSFKLPMKIAGLETRRDSSSCVCCVLGQKNSRRSDETMASFDCEAFAKVKKHVVLKKTGFSFGSTHPMGYHFNDVGRQFDQAWISRSCCVEIVPGQETLEIHL